MAKRITLRNNTSTNTGKGTKMSHAEMDANLETFFMSSSLDGTTLYLHSTGSTNTDAIDLSGIVGLGAQGPQGANGANGIGTQGTQGATGTGTQGAQGANGSSGVGTQGVQGIVGTQGSQGIAGGASSQGIQGIQGSEGPQGLTGSGTQGVQGTEGPQGLTGTGIQGVQGIAGGASAQGVQGEQGIQGLTGTGTQGVQGLTGTGTQGVQGSAGTGIQGVQGEQGPQGLTGTGTQGVQGITGANGSTSGRIYYFNRSITEPNTGKSELGTTPTAGSEVSMNVLSIQNTDTKLIDFISQPFDFTVIPGGVQRFYLWMTKENQNDHIEAYVVLKVTDNAGNVLVTAGTSQAVDVTWNNNNTTPSLVNVDITFPTTSVSIGQRMLVEVWTRNNENQNYTTTLYTEGASHYSYVVTSVGAQSGTQGVQGITGTGTQGVQGEQGPQGIQGQGITATSLTLGSSSSPLGDHTDSAKHTVQTSWTRLSTTGASFTNNSGGTKSYLVVLGLEMDATYTGTTPVPFGIDVKFADKTSGALTYTEWRDTVQISASGETSRRVTKTYVSHVYQLSSGSDFAVWVKGTPYLSEQLYIQYALLTVTELTGTPVAIMN